ncbi:P-loop containing nucleoside triphosphate hydrolase protein [Naematelia encephala]|uniref:ATP-dependent RNA helicase n=1 Tax=Naematelia encephala TaxID=71784 RepID=A0A1Y2B6I9_9TREE|nr:P-loop containing nucleoside triphosphate hydrolase protein [Naematelia encephala]
MNDDGIELNFTTSSGPSISAVRRQVATKKGGRWTDRAQSRKDARRTVKRLVETIPTQPIPNSVLPVSATTPKSAPPLSATSAITTRVASNSTSKPSPRPTPAQAKATAHRLEARNYDEVPIAGPSRPQVSTTFAPVKSKAPQIISSLFSSNPLPSAPSTSKTGATPLGAPSNAPLDTSTFAGLGLDPLLVRHLKGKMKVDKPTGIQQSALPYLISSPLDTDRRPDVEQLNQPEEVLRDVFIQSQTGSGKTLSYLLPIIQTLLPLSRLSYIDRSIGTLAIILAPTRELAQQISKVLEQLLSLSLSSAENDDQHLTRWLVSGLLTGGSTRTHEKARLRKGVPILVSTPGRLLDHLQNTASFQCSKTLFLVLDEADRLMDLGFEETIKGIIRALDGRRRNGINAEKEMDEEGGGTMRWPFWSRGRRTVLCSATVDAKVERLSGDALHDPIVFRSSRDDAADETKGGKKDNAAVKVALEEANAIVLPVTDDKFTPPSQLSQKYIVTPTKLRLVTLVALLRSLIAKKGGEESGTKIIVFLSSTDAVDFHWKLLGGVSMGRPQAEAAPEVDGRLAEEAAESADEGDTPSKIKATAKSKKASAEEVVALSSPLFPSTTLFRLHGSLPLRTRLASLQAFAAASPSASVLFATSVASRGLDLPLVRAVVQYDLPTEGGANEYVHRVGRTARAGKGGEAWAFVSPSETEWVSWVEGKMGKAEGQNGTSVKLGQVGVEDVLKRGFGGKGFEFEGRATDVQLGFERWVLSDDKNAVFARKAFSSYVRAYSTHPLDEKKFFHPKSLHLGHLAKAFALREAPGALSAATKSSSKHANPINSNSNNKRKRATEGDDGESDEDGKGGKKQGKESTARNETERRMYEAVRKQGRAIKSGGAMGEFAGGKGGQRGVSGGGGGEFQIVGGGELERLVGGR